jgi:hypothetical protein
MVEIASVSGNTLTFTTPLHMSFLTSRTAQLSRYGETWRTAPVPAVRYSGIEDLKIEGGRGGDSGGNAHFFVAAYSWIKNIDAYRSKGSSINLDGCFRCVVRDSYIHTSQNPNPGGDGYMMSIGYGSADNLIENNIMWDGNKNIVMRATGGGNVIGYNYMDDAYGASYPTFVEVGVNGSHMTTPHYELFEGNYGFNFDSDSVWGNSVYCIP